MEKKIEEACMKRKRKVTKNFIINDFDEIKSKWAETGVQNM